MRSKEEFEQRLKLAKQRGYITKAEMKTLVPDADENTVLVMSHILFHLGIKLFEESPTEGELTLLQSNQEEEDPDNILRDAEMLCSVDHESGRMTDPIRFTWDEFGTYAHLSNGRIEGPFNSERALAAQTLCHSFFSFKKQEQQLHRNAQQLLIHLVSEMEIPENTSATAATNPWLIHR